MSTTLELDISAPSKEFETFIAPEDNERIIFSGIFGSGKTYFLRKFFENNAEYLPIFINPINYSVAQNEDIFQLIKYDLLYEILQHKPYLEKINPSDLEAIPFLQYEDTWQTLAPFIRSIPKLGKLVAGAAESITRLKSLLDHKKGEIEIDESKQISQFLDIIHKTGGSIYENDLYSQLIEILLQRIKAPDKKTVMIVDDLDRIDPEHVFRIMNVFAAHFRAETLEEEKNKFGIDKIILCCDIENIRSIFRSRYGIEVDFNGYIDKFYSKSIFNFNNRFAVVQSVAKILKSVKIEPQQRDFVYPLTPDTYYFHFSVVLITSLILSDKLNVRSLKKVFGTEYKVPFYSIHFQGQRIENWQVPIITLFDFIHSLFGTFDAAISALEGTLLIPTHHENLAQLDCRMTDPTFLDLFAELVALSENKTNGLRPETDFHSDEVSASPFPYHLMPQHKRSVFHPHLIGRFGSLERGRSSERPYVNLDLFLRKFVEAFHVWANARKSTIQKV